MISPVSRQPAVAPTPISVVVEKNQVLSRFLVLLGGYIPSDMLVARNGYERAEKALDHAFWLLFGLTVPVLLERFFNTKFSKKINQKFNLPEVKASPLTKNANWAQRFIHVLEGNGKHSPLQLSFQWLDSSYTPKAKELNYVSKQLHLSKEKLSQLIKTPQFKKMVMGGKQAILAADLAFMALNGQLSVWAKNVMTELSSGKKGFSGLFNTASNTYVEESTKEYDKNKKKRLLPSLGLAAWSVASLPLLLKALIKAPNRGLGRLGKKLIPLADYTDTVYMSRWVFLWYSLHNYVLAGALAARGKDERREHLVRSLTLDFFYAIGDLLFISAIAKGFQKMLGKKKLQGVSLTKPNSWVPKPLGRVLNEVGGNVKHPAYRWAKANYWLGLGLTTAFLGLSIPLMNIIYTKNKVVSKERENAAKKLLGLQTQPFQNHQKAFL